MSAESWRFARRPDKQSTGLFSPLFFLTFVKFSQSRQIGYRRFPPPANLRTLQLSIQKIMATLR